MERFRLDGRVAVVTGAGRGIGLAIAGVFVEAGARVVVAELDADLGRAAAARLGPDAEFAPLDVTDPAMVERAADGIAGRHGRVDVLVNNAGACINAEALETTDDIWRRQMAVNLDGVFFCCRAFGRHMVERKAGSIVNMSSIAGLIDIRPQNHVAYSTAKAGVIQVSRVLASEWAAHGVRVNAIAPGYVATDMPLSVGAGFLDRWKSMIPIGRLMDPKEIASAVLFLASDAGSSVTGHVLLADGGYTSW